MSESYLRSVRVLVASELILRARGLILIPILTKHFGAANYGIWSQVTVIVSLVSPLIALGLDSAVLRFFPGRPAADVAKGFWSVIVYLLLAAIPVGVVLWLGSEWIARVFFGAAENAPFVSVCGIALVVALLLNQCRNLFRAIGSAVGFAVMSLVQGLSAVVLGTIVAAVHGTVWALVCATVAADAALLVVALFAIVRRIGVAAPDWRRLGTYVRYGLPLVPAGYAVWTLNSSDRLFIAHYRTLGDIGVYSVVYSLGYMIISLIANPLWVMYPASAAEAFNRHDVGQLRSLFDGVVRAMLGFLIPAVVALGVLARPLLALMTNAEFVSGAPLVPVIAAAYVIFMLSSFFEVNLGLVDKQVWCSINVTIGMCVNVALNFFAVPRFGIAGAAVTTLIGFAVHCTLSVMVGIRALPMPFDFRFLSKVLAASALMGAAMIFIPTAGSAWLIGPPVLVGAGVYASIMLALRAVTPSELRLMLSTVHGRLVPPAAGELI